MTCLCRFQNILISSLFFHLWITWYGFFDDLCWKCLKLWLESANIITTLLRPPDTLIKYKHIWSSSSNDSVKTDSNYIFCEYVCSTTHPHTHLTVGGGLEPPFQRSCCGCWAALRCVTDWCSGSCLHCCADNLDYPSVTLTWPEYAYWPTHTAHTPVQICTLNEHSHPFFKHFNILHPSSTKSTMED